MRTARFNPRLREQAEHLAEPAEGPTAIIPPTILIILSNKIAHGSPILLLDLREKMGRVQSNLSFWSP